MRTNRGWSARQSMPLFYLAGAYMDGCFQLPALLHHTKRQDDFCAVAALHRSAWGGAVRSKSIFS